ncbi:MAG: signal recognition particle protein [Clostridia bacterium]|nr:MAG: signal recognition particle protein [Clostridia bacterium]
MAAFSNLTDRLQGIFKKLRGHGKLSEADVQAALREVRLALLEADVNYKVVKDFITSVQARAVGEEVFHSLTPAQTVIKIVNEELARLMGGVPSELRLASRPPTLIMLVGLQGAGKTTTAAKLAKSLGKKGKRCLLVAADIYRPAAVQQLQVLGEQAGLPVFTGTPGTTPVNICQAAVERAEADGIDVVIMDTAGRLHINAEMMRELQEIKAAVSPHEVLLVVDAMTGQDAVQVASSFNQDLGLSGAILTKLDGDARGGAALSVTQVAGCPIKFVGLGEKLDALEPFFPDRMASRILGMGDVLSLIEKAQETVDTQQARELQAKLRHQDFTLEDFRDQLRQMRKMGSVQDIVNMLPGVGLGKELRKADVDEKELVRVEAIICSMTPQERTRPEIINGSRKRRIARGSGTKVQDINRLLHQFEEARRLMKQLAQGGAKGKRGLNLPFVH